MSQKAEVMAVLKESSSSCILITCPLLLSTSHVNIRQSSKQAYEAYTVLIRTAQ